MGSLGALIALVDGALEGPHWAALGAPLLQEVNLFRWRDSVVEGCAPVDPLLGFVECGELR